MAATIVHIDDSCDVCGNYQVEGVNYGFGKPIICRDCLEDGVNAWNEGRLNSSAFRKKPAIDSVELTLNFPNPTF